MSILSAHIVNKPIIVTDTFFSLEITSHTNFTTIDMQLFVPIVTTKFVPLTFDILHSELPSVLQSNCFNDDHIPFSTEVKTTELGHLFEHILLEFLCEQKLALGYEEVEYSGETDWNWAREPRGTFHISISSTKHEMDLFASALDKTIKLMKTILYTESVSLSANSIPNRVADTFLRPALKN